MPSNQIACALQKPSSSSSQFALDATYNSGTMHAVTERLSKQDFAAVVAHAPLIAIDLVVADPDGHILLGKRTNPPAQDFWFVPGGRIRKNETMQSAFTRIAEDEIGLRIASTPRKLLGIYEHFYDVNFLGEQGDGTHYVVLAYHLTVNRDALKPGAAQHYRYLWVPPGDSKQMPDIHPYALTYFRELNEI